MMLSNDKLKMPSDAEFSNIETIVVVLGLFPYVKMHYLEKNGLIFLQFDHFSAIFWPNPSDNDVALAKETKLAIILSDDLRPRYFTPDNAEISVLA